MACLVGLKERSVTIKIEKSINIDINVDVVVDSEDIYICFLADKEKGIRSEFYVLKMMKDCAQFLKGIPDEIVNDLTENQHEVIRDLLLKSADRFVKHLLPHKKNKGE